MLHILEHEVKKWGQKFSNYSLIDGFLLYFPNRNYPAKAKEHTEEAGGVREVREESTLEAELEEPGGRETVLEETDKILEKEMSNPLEMQYLRLPLYRNLMQTLGMDENTDQDRLYGNLTSLLAEDEEYKPSKSSASADDNYESGFSIDEEAKETLRESKYEFMVPSVDIDPEEQQKLALWIQFNQALFAFMESFYGLNREIDYTTAA